MRFIEKQKIEKQKSAIAYLLTCVTLANVLGCSQPASQAKPPENIAPPVATALPVVATAKDKPKRSFNPELIKAYIDGCQSSGGTKEYCNCFISKIKSALTPDEFDKAGESFKSSGKIPPAIDKAMQSCQPAPKPANPTSNQSPDQPVKTTSSVSQEILLARHLKKIGAVLYGTYWCPYCTRQKQAFGNAISEIQYIECDPRGSNPQPNLCDNFGVRSYPTWQINGKSYSGSYDLISLAEISGYKGFRN